MIGRFKEPLPPEVREAQREQGQEQDRKLFTDTGNAFYALWALARYRADEELPLWVRKWLLAFAKGVLPAFLHLPARTARPATATRRAIPAQPEYIPVASEARKQVLRPFGLGQGKDGIAEVQQVITDDVLAIMRKADNPKSNPSGYFGLYTAKELGTFLRIDGDQVRRRTNRAKKRWPE